MLLGVFQALLDNGATVIVNYNGSAAKAEEVVNEITANGGMAESMQCSVSDFEKSKEMIDGIVKKYGRLDILVNNAGVSDSTPIDKYTAERFASVMDLNVNAMMNGILPTVAIMKEQGGGCILNTSTGTWSFPYPCKRGCTWHHPYRYGCRTSKRND